MKNLKIILLGLSFSTLALAYPPSNFFTPYNINWRLPDVKDKKFLFNINFEHGNTNDCRNGGEDKAPVLRLYNATESSLAMLLGAQVGSDIYNKANLLLPAYAPATDDGVRGCFELDGKFEQTNINLLAKYKLPIETIPGNFDLLVHVPMTHMVVKDVVWRDLTKNVLACDFDVHAQLTDDIVNNVNTLGDGLNLEGFDRMGFGDLVVMLWWYNDYKQLKEHLKNVRLNFRLGLSAPTGHKINEDKSIDFPFGNDGSWGVPLAGAIDLDFIHAFKLGLEFEMLFLFDNTRIRRLKTDSNQTDYLLLHKGNATLSQGMTWKFNLFIQKKFGNYITAKIAYQFLKKDSDKLTAESNNFDYSIINTAQKLQEWMTQDFIFKLDIDLFKESSKYAFKPQFSMFAKVPVTGKRIVSAYTFGGQLGFNF